MELALLFNKLTNLMEQTASSEANSRLFSHIYLLLSKPHLYCRIYKSPPCSVVSQMSSLRPLNPVSAF